jgi:hypothetical protein
MALAIPKRVAKHYRAGELDGAAVSFTADTSNRVEGVHILYPNGDKDLWMWRSGNVWSLKQVRAGELVGRFKFAPAAVVGEHQPLA